ncbi:MAG: glycosyltransferase family 2 protein [Actinomycetota bacterium]
MNDDSWNRVRRVALAIPAYNEADGIAGFIGDLDGVLDLFCDEHTFVIINDVSTDDTVSVLQALAPKLAGNLILETNAVNSGHGPTVLNAYDRALATDTEWVLQVDGDGQFEAEDIELLFRHASGGAPMVTGRRVVRFDPWYRKVVSKILPGMLRLGFGVRRVDINCPFRLYRADVLREILAEVPDAAYTPHVLMTVLEDRRPERHVEVPVQHRPRRGDTEAGTMFGARNILIPKKLMLFLRDSFVQLVEFRRSL